MIRKYRNRAALYSVVAVALTVLFVVLLRKSWHVRPSEDVSNLEALWVLIYFAAWSMWALTSLSLARAKGYSRDMVGTLFAVLFIIGSCCIPAVVILLPFYIIFALEDKTRDRIRRH